MIDEVVCPQCSHGSRGLAGYQSGRADEVEERLKAPSVMQNNHYTTVLHFCMQFEFGMNSYRFQSLASCMYIYKVHFKFNRLMGEPLCGCELSRHATVQMCWCMQVGSRPKVDARRL